MKKEFFISILFLVSNSFAADFNMNKAMKEMKVSLKCLTGKAGFTDSCKSDLEEVAKMQNLLKESEAASKAYYLKLYNDKIIPQVPNSGDIQKAFQDISQELSKTAQAIKTSDTQLKISSLEAVQKLIKKSHDSYKPEVE